jgi:hypothetical protein
VNGTRLSRIEREIGGECPECADWPQHRVLRLRVKIVGPGDAISPAKEPSLTACPRCGRPAPKVSRIELVREVNGSQQEATPQVRHA